MWTRALRDPSEEERSRCSSPNCLLQMLQMPFLAPFQCTNSLNSMFTFERALLSGQFESDFKWRCRCAHCGSSDRVYRQSPFDKVRLIAPIRQNLFDRILSTESVRQSLQHPPKPD